MSESVEPWLWWLTLVPIGIALAMLPVSTLLPRSVVGLAVVLAGAFTAALTAWLFLEELSLGAWSMMNTDGFRGHLFRALDLDGKEVLAAHPMTLLLGAALCMGGLLCVVEALRGWGGGERQERIPATSGVLLGQLLLVGLGAVVVFARQIDLMIAAFVLMSWVGSALSFSARPQQKGLDTAARLFIWHRVGDAALALGFIGFSSSFGELEPVALAANITQHDSWTRMPSGPWAGFPMGQTLKWCTGFLGFGIITRLPLFPLPPLAARVTGATTTTNAHVHILGSYVLALVLLCKLSALLYCVPEWMPALSIWAMGSALMGALSAATATSALRSDMFLLHAYAVAGVAAVGLGQVGAAVLITMHLALLAPVVASTTGAAIEALQGTTSLFEMGGLAKALPRSERARTLAVLSIGFPGFVTFLAFERVLLEARVGPFQIGAWGLLWVFALFAIAFAAYRSMHLMFAGPSPRGPVPARLVEVTWWRSLGPLCTMLAVVFLGCIAVLPSAWLNAYYPGHQEPFGHFLWPSLEWMSPFAMDETGAWRSEGVLVSENLRGQSAFGGGLVVLAAYVLSAFLYRKGPSSFHRLVTTQPWLQKSIRLWDGDSWVDQAFLRISKATVVPIAQVMRTVMVHIVFGDVLTRWTTWVGALLRACLRVFHNGDLQRSLTLWLLVLVWLLWSWGRA